MTDQPVSGSDPEKVQTKAGKALMDKFDGFESRWMSHEQFEARLVAIEDEAAAPLREAAFALIAEWDNDGETIFAERELRQALALVSETTAVDGEKP